MRAYYDWPRLKAEYLASNYREVRVFLDDKHLPYNSHIRSQTRGWGRQKAVLIKEAIQDIKPSPFDSKETQARYGLHLILDRICADLKTRGSKLTSNEIKAYWEILRTEAELPIRFSGTYRYRQTQKDGETSPEEDFKRLMTWLDENDKGENQSADKQMVQG